MNVVDSSAWLEYFADGPNASYFAAAIEDKARLVVPAIVIYEVFKRLLQLQRSETQALMSVAVLKGGRVVDLDAPLALAAARLGAELKLPLADSVVLATARRAEATLWTQDSDFEGLENVRYRAHRGA
jgi:predicted nucleic acid-binding protein